MSKGLQAIKHALSIGWWCDPVVGVVYKPNGQPARTYVNGSGYFVVNIPRPNPEKPQSMYKTCEVHRIVSYVVWGEDAFLGHKLVQTRHLNGNRKDNRIDNLALGTPSQNAMDMKPEMRSERSRKRWQSLTQSQRDEWKCKINEGKSSKAQQAVTNVFGK